MDPFEVIGRLMQWDGTMCGFDERLINNPTSAMTCGTFTTRTCKFVSSLLLTSSSLSSYESLHARRNCVSHLPNKLSSGPTIIKMSSLNLKYFLTPNSRSVLRSVAKCFSYWLKKNHSLISEFAPMPPPSQTR
jgi:hypothetical protein